jgi:Uma2 family endonuclease
MTAALPAWPITERDSAEPEVFELTLRDVPLPVTIRLARPLSDEELLAFCAANDGLEIESDADGSITVMTPAGFETIRLNQILLLRLGVWAEQKGNGIVCGTDLGVRFVDKTLRAPDAAWLSNERVKTARGRAKKLKGFLPVCPEFVAELRSPSDRVSKIEAKMEFWMARGAQLGWLIDPERKLAMIYRPEREPETLLKPEFLEGEGPIKGFRLAMQEFWA